MLKFRLYRSSIEIGYQLETGGPLRFADSYEPFITQFRKGGNERELIAEFASEEDALLALGREEYIPYTNNAHNLYVEYYVSVEEVDEDGEWLDCPGEWQWNYNNAYKWHEDKNHNIIIDEENKND